MATVVSRVRAPSDTNRSPRPQASPAGSATSLRSSRHSHDGGHSVASSTTAASDVREPGATPQAAGQQVDQNQTLHPKKPNLSTRLTRMFSVKGDSSNSNSSENINGLAKQAVSEASASSLATDDSKSTQTSRRPSATGAPDGPKKEHDVAYPGLSRRFTMYEDGTHDHHLKNEKRQQKLSDMFSRIIGVKKDGDDGFKDNQLSLVSSWVDQIKSEKVAADQKGGPNCQSSLVEKYGKCQEVVGRGAFGIVRISHKADNTDPKKEQLYAIKEFRRRPSESPKKYNKRLTSEFCISSALRHPNVIHTLDLMKDAKGDFCAVMEFCPGGDLYSLVLAAGKLEVVEADCYFKQLMRGVEYIHEMGVAHRDLKPENLLLTTHGALKITDFGNGECFRMAWEKEAHMVAGLCGSAPYIAPEEYIDQEFDPRAVDVWACGVIYMAMRSGRHLWRIAKRDEDEFFERYLEGRRDEDGYGPIEMLHRARCRNVIYSILDPNPSRRITATQVLKSEWGREIKLCKAGEEGF